MPDKRDRFLAFNREHMETAFVAATKDGVDRPLVVGLDLENPTAKQIASARTSTEEVVQRIRYCKANDASSCLFFYVLHDDAVACFSDLTANAKDFLNTEIPDDAYRYLIITTSGVRWGTARLPE